MRDIKNNKSTFWPGLLFFVCGLALCGTTFYFSFGGIIKKWQFDSSVEAIKIDENEHYERVSSDNSNRKRKQIMYSPSYTYVVDGTERVCKADISYGYKVNKKYNKVYYDSKNPSDCMIEYLVYPDPLVYIAFGLSLFMPIAGFQMMTGNNYLKKKKTVKLL